MDKYDNVDTALLSIGSIYSLANLETILGVIILILQITWIFIKMVASVVSKVKANKSAKDIAKELPSELKEAVKEVNDFDIKR